MMSVFWGIRYIVKYRYLYVKIDISGNIDICKNRYIDICICKISHISLKRIHFPLSFKKEHSLTLRILGTR